MAVAGCGSMGDERDDLIVSRLRAWAALRQETDARMCREAADEIVRLRAALDAADDLYDAVEDHGHMDDCPAVAAFRAVREGS